MFLEEKKAGEVQVEQPSLVGFIAFLEKMPAKGVFNWKSGQNCVCAQYAKSIGQYESWGRFCGVSLGRNESSMREILEKLNLIAYHSAETSPFYEGTFGKALKIAKVST